MMAENVSVISLDRSRCSRCGICIARFDGYCITGENGYPVFDYTLCNVCQKCVSICPSAAILVDGVIPDPLNASRYSGKIDPEALLDFFSSRRSIKLFQKKSVERHVTEKIISAASSAPNQNKNISLTVVDDPLLIQEIDTSALRFIRRIYRLLFGFPPLTLFFRLFSRGLPVIRKKMEYDLFRQKRIVKKNSQVLVILHGPARVPVTRSSAHYLLSAMIYQAHSMGVGSCLMDSLKISMQQDRKLKKRLGIFGDVLGVLVLGYPAENLVNVPRGYNPDVRWNGTQPPE